VIARLWHGRTSPARAEEYTRFLERTGLKDYRSTPGNRGVLMLRRLDRETADFQLISFWDSFDAIRRFAGEDVERAFYYPEDDTFLLEKEPHVAHYEVVSSEPEITR
jgi:heme-degrading monooxygenase HmoA